MEKVQENIILCSDVVLLYTCSLVPRRSNISTWPGYEASTPVIFYVSCVVSIETRKRRRLQLPRLDIL